MVWMVSVVFVRTTTNDEFPWLQFSINLYSLHFLEYFLLQRLVFDMFSYKCRLSNHAVVIGLVYDTKCLVMLLYFNANWSVEVL